MSSRPLTRAAAAALALLAALTAGCDRAIDGSAVAAPGAAGAPAALLNTTCRDYTAMKDSGRRQVIAAIGAEGNQLVAMNPDMWVGIAVALCTFADPGAPVRDVVTGGIR